MEATGAGATTADAAGVRIPYDDFGRGEPALVFMTGWASDRRRWSDVPRLCAEHRRVLNFEWRGHGASDVPASDFGGDELVEDAVAVIEAAGVETFVPCAASHSGWVAIELRRRLGERVPKIVFVDWLVVEPPDRFRDTMTSLRDPDKWHAARAGLFGMWRGGIENAEVDDALAVMESHGAEMWMRCAREIMASYDRYGSPLRALEELDSPPEVLHMYAQPPDAGYLAAQESFAAAHPWYHVQKLDARTHFTMIERPREVAAAITRFVG